MPEDPYAPEYRYGQNQTPSNVNEVQAAPKLTPVEIPSWQMAQLVRSLDDYFQSEHQAEIRKRDGCIKDMSEDIRRYQKEEDNLRYRAKKLEQQVQMLEAQIGRLCIEKGIIR